MSEVPTLPWKRIEEFFFELAQKGQIMHSGMNNNSDAFKFLNNIGFLDKDGKLTEIGRSYYFQKLILNKENEALELLSDSIKGLKCVQMICQIFWGRAGITKDNLISLLLIENFIDKGVKSDIGPLLSLLNKCKILSYDKKSGVIKILYNPKVESNEIKTTFISPQTPYTNVKNLRQILEATKKYIWWFDKHFSLKGFEPLSEVVDGNYVQEIRILTGNSNVNEKFKKDFERFQAEMNFRGIKAECKVIVNPSLYHQIHDRWLITENAAYNLPAVNTIYQNQYAEILKTENKPPFEDWWKEGKDLILNWSDIVNSKSN